MEREKVRERKLPGEENSGKHEEDNSRDRETVAKGRNREGNGWTEVRNRKARAVETNIYVSNLPSGYNSTKLWKAFAHLEGLSDAFVPSKKNELGRVFGFLRFKNIRNEAYLIKRITSLKLEGVWIQANISKYGRDSKSEFIRKERFNGVNTKIPQQQKGSRMSSFNMERQHWKLGGTSYKDMLQGNQQKERLEEEIVINLGHNEVTGLVNLIGRAFIGEAKDLTSLNSLAENMQGKVPVNTFVRYVGGLKTLISFNNDQDANTFLEAKNDCWGAWFNSMTRWQGVENYQDRVARLNIKGIPIHTWSSKTSDIIAARFGRILGSSMADSRDGYLLEDKVVILAKQTEKIRCKVKLIHKGRVYVVHVEEEDGTWKPSFLQDQGGKLINGIVQSNEPSSQPESNGSPEKPPEIIMEDVEPKETFPIPNTTPPIPKSRPLNVEGGNNFSNGPENLGGPTVGPLNTGGPNGPEKGNGLNVPTSDNGSFLDKTNNGPLVDESGSSGADHAAVPAEEGNSIESQRKEVGTAGQKKKEKRGIEEGHYRAKTKKEKYEKGDRTQTATNQQSH